MDFVRSEARKIAREEIEKALKAPPEEPAAPPEEPAAKLKK